MVAATIVRCRSSVISESCGVRRSTTGRDLGALALVVRPARHLIPNHVSAPSSRRAPRPTGGPTLICKSLQMVPVEVRRPRLSHRLRLSSTNESRTVCGLALPEGLVDAANSRPRSSPATKAAVGEHDENVSYERWPQVGADTAAQLRRRPRRLRPRPGHRPRPGIILADTKFEFGFEGETLIAATGLTPDSSRFWPAEEWEPGRAQPSYDKQFVRDWLTGPESGWDRRSEQPPPALPQQVVAATRAKYIEAYERLTGLSWS